MLSGLLLGLAGSVHCIAMCGAACTAITARCGGNRPQQALLAFHGGRLLGYSAAGAVAAASVGAIASLSSWSPSLRPLWTLVHAAALGLGLWLLFMGRQPAWVEAIGRGAQRTFKPAAAGAGGWQAMKGPARAGAAGTLWFAWPCGLLQSALVVAALANSPASGALVMAAFAIGSSLGLWVGPALWWRLGPAGTALGQGGWAIRIAGLGLAAGSGWALSHGLWQRVADYCGF